MPFSTWLPAQPFAFFSATPPLLSTTLHRFHFCQMCSVFSTCPSNFSERPRLRRVNAGTCVFCIWAWTNHRIKERRTKAHQHHSLLVSSQNGHAASFEGATDVVFAFVWVIDASLGDYYASKNNKISHLVFPARQIGVAHVSHRASTQSTGLTCRCSAMLVELLWVRAGISPE